MLKHFCVELPVKDITELLRHMKQCSISIAHNRAQRFGLTYKLPDENKFWEFSYYYVKKVSLIRTSIDEY
jgi:hypothetical protein